ncbi:hypothetical protein [Streptomyces sp. NPDC002990]
MRVSRYLIAAACACACVLCPGAASAAPPPDAPAWVTPSVVGPNDRLRVTVVCPVTDGPPGTITADSQLFGEVVLGLQPGEKYGGHTYAGTTKIGSDVRGRPGDPNYLPDRVQTWGIDGECPNGSRFTTAVAVDTLKPSTQPHHAPEPAPSPSRTYRVGDVSPDTSALPMCGLRRGNAYVVIDQGRAVIVDGTGRYVQAVLTPGQTEDRTYEVTFNRDGKSITYTPDGSTKPVTEVCG